MFSLKYYNYMNCYIKKILVLFVSFILPGIISAEVFTPNDYDSSLTFDLTSDWYKIGNVPRGQFSYYNKDNGTEIHVTEMGKMGGMVTLGYGEDWAKKGYIEGILSQVNLEINGDYDTWRNQTSWIGTTSATTTDGETLYGWVRVFKTNRYRYIAILLAEKDYHSNSKKDILNFFNTFIDVEL